MDTSFKKRQDTMDRNVNIIVGLNGEKMVLINDIRFKGKKREDWKEVENYLKEKVQLRRPKPMRHRGYRN